MEGGNTPAAKNPPARDDSIIAHCHAAGETLGRAATILRLLAKESIATTRDREETFEHATIMNTVFAFEGENQLHVTAPDCFG